MTLKKSIVALTEAPTKPAVLAPAPAVGARAPARSVGRAQASLSGGGTVFEESDYNLRQYWPDDDLVDPSGFFALQVKPIKSIAMVNGPPATLKEPT